MTFWLYQPSQFFKASSILPYKSNDAGDLLNFLTVLLLSLGAYMKNRVHDNIWKKIVIGGILFLVVASLFTIKKDESETIDGIQMPKYNDYDFSLSVD